MSTFSIGNVSIKGIACAVPKNIEYNKDYSYHSDLEKQQFAKTTGIKQRRVVKDNTTASDLCFVSAKKLLKKLNWQASEIDILIFISQTPDYLIPATAPYLQNKLGLSKTSMAFDINLGCSAYVYGISVVASLLQNIKGKALLLVGDVSSKIINKKDKTVAPLFSDAGSCTALEYQENLYKMYFNLQTDGSGFEAIQIKDGGMRNPFSKESLLVDENTNRSPIQMKLDGINIFNFSRKEVVPNIENLLKSFSLNKNEIDYYVLHQANYFMNEFIRKKMKVEEEKVPYSLKNFGNTSSASIPITLINNLRKELEEKSLILLLSGFGVGLSWGSIYIKTNKITTLPLIEV